MPGIILSGLASGLDWQSLVSQLIAAERTPETALRAQQGVDTQKISAFDTINTDLLALQTSATALSDNNVFLGRAAAFVDAAPGWSVTASPGAEVGDHTFNVLSLATKAQLVGAADAGAEISATSDVSGVTLATMSLNSPITAGNFTVNGAQIAVSTTDSLQDVFDRISSATGGAVSASYDPVTDSVSLSSGSEIVLGSANDSSNFLSAMKLYNNGTGNVTSTGSLGVVNTSAALVNANLKEIPAVDSNGDGSFTINGVTIPFNVNDDSIEAVLSRINLAGAGVTATYDTLSDKFTLTNNTTGDVGLSISESAGGLLEAMGLNATGTRVRGQNASVQVDGGGTLVSTTNSFDESLTGIQGLSVTASSVGSHTVTVGSDTSDAEAKIQDFIDKYNALQSYIDSQTLTTSTGTTVTTSLLSGNRDLTELASSLRNIVFQSIPGLSGTIQRLEGMGIDFDGTSSQLQIKDQSKLDLALQDHPDDVQALFNGSGGLVSSLNTFVIGVTGTSGLIATEKNRFTADSKSIDDQIASMERRILQDQDRLIASFVAMEQAQANIQQQSAAFANAFPSTTSG
ncbi:MAG TPA: flagellar filament capping protein FliD [Chthoniobacterales bacterium]|jgi:flagellar hook-associated protein 2